VSVREFAGEAPHVMGINQGRNERVPLAATKLLAQVEFTEWTPTVI
jgi:hypothetical protein